MKKCRGAEKKSEGRACIEEAKQQRRVHEISVTQIKGERRMAGEWVGRRTADDGRYG